MLRDLLLITASIAAFKLIDWTSAEFFCWRKRRQTQRQAQADLMRLRKESDERAAAARERELALSNSYGKQLAQYPFVLELENNHQFILATREIVCSLRAQDSRRFLTCDHTREDN